MLAYGNRAGRHAVADSHAKKWPGSRLAPGTRKDSTYVLRAIRLYQLYEAIDQLRRGFQFA